MGRKPRIQSRTGPAVKAPRAKKRFHQCLRCGALTDPIYGLGDDSWCPSCQYMGHITYAEGQIPAPSLYGSWVIQQKKTSGNDVLPKTGQAAEAAGDTVTTTSPSSSTYGGSGMQIVQYLFGRYHCPACCKEFELFCETVLKCKQCGGRLVKGPLDKDPDEYRDD